jgi:Polyketide cyclase / dehydrase and lipid transport
MASIRKETIVDASADQAWDAIRDVGEVHRRVVAGFVRDCRMDGDARVVSFANGLVARELIVDVDDAARRLVWSARSERLQHHNASLQVFEEAPGRCRVVWIADLLPHAAAAAVGAMMEEGVAAMRKTLAAHSRAA